MNIAPRHKIFPKAPHFGFKRPVFFDAPVIEPEKEKTDNDIKPKDKENPPKHFAISQLPFSSSFEVFETPQDTSFDTDFEWLNEDNENDLESFFSDSQIQLEYSNIFSSSDDADFKDDILL